jgi:hypothetical protein
MAPQWTPGPWEQRTLMVMANKGRDCIVHCGGMLKPIPQRVYEMEANARLIAAAPEMAEVLGCLIDDLVGALETYSTGPVENIKRARALLARIRGAAA